MNRNMAEPVLTIPDVTEKNTSGKNKCASPMLEESNNLNILHLPQKRSSSFKKAREKNLDAFLKDEIRPRTQSMPTRGTIKKPESQQLQHALLRLSREPENETYTVRSFEMKRGVITKRLDSMRSRSTNSICSSEADLGSPSPLSPASSSVSRESLGISSNLVLPVTMSNFQVMVMGGPGVGKTGLAQQFMTSEYLGGFNTSIDGETVKTVNVLLNGEETALAFVEDTEDDLDDDASDNVAAYVIVYACDDRASFDRAVDTLYNLRQKQHTEHVIFFVGNKSDLIRSRCVPTGEAKAVAMTYDCKFVETSVVLNVNVDELLVGIVKQLRLRSAKYADDKCPGCASSSKSLLNKIFKKHNISQSCENLYT